MERLRIDVRGTDRPATPDIDRRGADATFNVLDIAIKICEAMPACYYEQIAIAAFEEEDEC